MALNVRSRSHQELYLGPRKYSQIDKEALSIVWAVRKFYLYLKGRRFTLITDHKPLIAIFFFGSKRGLPVLAATRLLHYALILQSFEFDIIFRKTIEHGNADFLSRLPKTSEELEVKDDITIFQMSQIEALPVTSKELRQETNKDIELGPLLRALREVAVRVYRAANTRWKFGTIVNQDGVLHYIIDVQGTLVRRHVDQIRSVGDKVQENIIPLMHQRFPSSEVRENNSNIQHAETAEDISKDQNKELGSSSVQGVPSTDVAVPDLSQSSAKETDSETRSPPVPDRPFPRRSGRIRRPPERLVL
ncbi:transposon Tf2-8 polyprotein [Trichonephila clavipes]|nr:transposon Tf2-8 polyprotein [Trichonephila clavipes]